MLWRGPKAVDKTDIEILYEPECRRYAKHGCKVQIQYTGRLAVSGCIFDGSRSKNGGVPFEFVVGSGSVVLGMDDAVRAIALGGACRARVPASRGYGHKGIDRLIPGDAPLVFDIILLAIDNDQVLTKEAEAASLHFLKDGFGLEASRFKAPPELQTFVRVAKSIPDLLDQDAWLAVVQRVQPVPVMEKNEEKWQGKALAGSDSLCVLGSSYLDSSWSGLQAVWANWDRLISERWCTQLLVLAKLRAPIRPYETLADIAVLETTMAAFIKYIKTVDPFDENAPRFYVNGWQPSEHKSVFPNGLPSLDIPVVEDITLSHMIEFEIEVNALLFGRSDQNAKAVATATARANSNKLTKIFIGPSGAHTRLHRDNHGAHARLTVVTGAKLYIAFHPNDTPYLYPPQSGESDQSTHDNYQAMASSVAHFSPIDPLDPDLTTYPDYKYATPYLALLTQGQSILVPKDWWHCAYSLTPSLTIMRNFWSTSNVSELSDLQQSQLKTKLRTLKAAGLLRTA